MTVGVVPTPSAASGQTWPGAVTVPATGESRTTSTVLKAAFQNIVDRTAWLKARLAQGIQGLYSGGTPVNPMVGQLWMQPPATVLSLARQLYRYDPTVTIDTGAFTYNQGRLTSGNLGGGTWLHSMYALLNAKPGFNQSRIVAAATYKNAARTVFTLPAPATTWTNVDSSVTVSPAAVTQPGDIAFIDAAFNLNMASASSGDCCRISLQVIDQTATLYETPETMRAIYKSGANRFPLNVGMSTHFVVPQGMTSIHVTAAAYAGPSGTVQPEVCPYTMRVILFRP